MPPGHGHSRSCRCGFCKAKAGPPKRRRRKPVKKGGRGR